MSPVLGAKTTPVSAPAWDDFGEPQAKGEELTDLQRALSAIWRELLGFHEIGVTENFFALGGNSLAAIGVISRLRTTFHIDLPPSALIAAPTIAELASCMIAHEPAPGFMERTAHILRQIESMTEEELTQALVKEG